MILLTNPDHAPSDSGGETEYPAFDPEAAKAARQQRIAEYEAEHPKVEKNKEKAEEMAYAEKTHRDKMSDILNYAKSRKIPPTQRSYRNKTGNILSRVQVVGKRPFISDMSPMQ